MLSKDIDVGTEYAYRQRTYSPSQRARVESVGSGGVITVTFPESADPSKMWPVKARQIIHTWAEEQQDARAQAEYAEQAAARAETLRRERAALAYALHLRCLDAGVPSKVQWVSDYQGKRAALIEAGFAPGPGRMDEGGIHLDTQSVTSAVENLADILDKGVVPIDAVKVLLEEVSPT